MDGGGGQKIAEFAQHMRADGGLLIIADQGADVVLVLADIEMVHPEPGELFLELVFGIKVAQQRAGGGFARQLLQLLLIGLAAPRHCHRVPLLACTALLKVAHFGVDLR